VGGLRADGHRYRSVKEEIRENLLAAMAAGRPRFPGIVGFDGTVLPEVERSLLAGHDIVLLGERGQGKTRLIRSLVHLLDEWTPVIDGAELGEHPYRPMTPASVRRAAELGSDLPVAWRHRDDRYGEKLATPDTSVGDLIGDVDPVRVAQGRTLGDPETIHFGLVPRTHRGIFAVNELPDLAERIQVALLNVLEERDIQVRGYHLRLPLDLLMVASANPEDYTNRGRIITPLKDRFGAEVRTHYPTSLDDELALVRQEARLVAEVPDHVLEVIGRFTRGVRDSAAVDSRSGVSARFAIAAAETVAAGALRRAALRGAEPRTAELRTAEPGTPEPRTAEPGTPEPRTAEPPGRTEAVARIGDTEPVVSTLRGKVEFESGEEGREVEVLSHLLRVAVAETFRDRLGGLDLSAFVDLVGERTVETGELVTSAEIMQQVGTLAGLGKVLDRLGMGDSPGAAYSAAAVELVLEGLHLTRRLGKQVTDDGRTVYGG
jgi:magnesium chelatase subunit I